MKIGAVVLHYKFWPDVNATLDALAAQDYPIEHVLVVDNHSADGSADKLRDRADIEVIESDHNGGYAAGMNLGMVRLSTRGLDAILLLTHEAILNPTGLTGMVAALEAEPRIGAVAPLLAWRAQPDRVYSAGVYLEPQTWSTHHVGAGDAVTDWTNRERRTADSLDGAATLIRQQAIDTTGKMDERYFLYFEETDYFVRMRRAGWTVVCAPSAVALQQPGQPPAPLWVRNRLRFLARNAPRRVLSRELVRTTYLAAGDAFHGRRDEARERARGLVAFITGRSAKSLMSRR